MRPCVAGNGSLPDDSYVFYELGGVDVQSLMAEEGLRHDFKLGGGGVAAESQHLIDGLPAMRATFAHVMNRQREEAPQPVDGRVLLSAGSWGNGRPFHVHGPALFALGVGTKRWFIRRPNASFWWQRFEVPRESLTSSDELPVGWADQLWQCVQSEGDLLWVPDHLPHGAPRHAEPLTLGPNQDPDPASLIRIPFLQQHSTTRRRRSGSRWSSMKSLPSLLCMWPHKKVKRPQSRPCFARAT